MPILKPCPSHHTKMSNPCCSCGACCATYRVDFHPLELTGGSWAWKNGVPPEMTVKVTERLVRMKGTDHPQPRCVALDGKIGTMVSCAIYENRPSPCREFGPEHDACNTARKRHGLEPLEV